MRLQQRLPKSASRKIQRQATTQQFRKRLCNKGTKVSMISILQMDMLPIVYIEQLCTADLLSPQSGANSLFLSLNEKLFVLMSKHLRPLWAEEL